MPSTIREQLLEAVRSRLDAALAAPVERNRDAPINEAELPLVVILDADETRADTQWTGGDHMLQDLEIDIYAGGADMAAVAAAVDAIRGTILQTLAQQPQLGGLAIDLRHNATSPLQRDPNDGHPAAGSIGLLYTIEFAVKEGDPFTLFP